MKYQYWFARFLGVGAGTRQKLLDCYGTAKRIYDLGEKELREEAGLQEKVVQQFLREREAWDLDKEYRFFCDSGQGMVTLEDEGYPPVLKNIYQPPYAMFFSGNRHCLSMEKTVAIVGARNCSDYGKKMAMELGTMFGERGYMVVSGMARGIDTYAHQGCLKAGGLTTAVLGSGLDVCYPKENRWLYEKIKDSGCLLTEYPMGTNPLPRYFPLRNRIISGMAKWVIIVEAREKSGSLITVEWALEQGKEIYAVPGRVTDTLSNGCNALIAQGAGIVTSFENLLSNIEEIQMTGLKEMFSKEREQIKLKEECERIYQKFDYYPKSMELVMEETGMAWLPFLDALMELCEKGYIREVFKNEYVRCW